jgi:TRAP-type C4-dicarboxylate transport system permease small subunit
VGVDLVVRRLSPRSQALIDAATNLVSAILFALVSWQMFLYGAALAKSGEVSMSLEFPTYILVYLVAVAFGVLSLVIASDFLRHLRKVVQS